MCKVKWADYLAEVTSEPRKWLWPQRIPLGEITLIAGIQGMGKSLLTANFSSHITTGKLWPDKTQCPTGDVILIQAEDSISHTVRPRFDAAGTDLNKVMFIRGVPDPKDKKLIPFDIIKNFDRLIWLIEHTNNPQAVIIDPIGSYIGSIDIHRENQVRSVMFQLKMRLAEKYGIAVIIVVHLRKGGSEDPVLARVLGSTAFTGAARTVWGVAHDKDDPSRRMFVPMKHNLTSQATKGLEFFINTAPNGEGVVTWGESIDDLAEDVMKDHGMKAGSQVAKAKEIIHSALQAGPQLVTKIKEQMIQEDIGWRSANKAKVDLKIKSRKVGGDWIWSLPESEEKL